MESLGIDFRLIIAQVVNFGVLLFLLTKFLYKPIFKVLDERKKKIAKSLEDAQKIEEAKIQLEEKKKQELARAHEAGVRVFEELKADGEREKEKIIQQAKSEAERTLQKTREQLALEAEKIRKSIKDEVAGLSIAVAQKIIGAKLQRVDQKFFFGESLKELKGEVNEISTLPEEFLHFSRRNTAPRAVKIAQELLVLLKKTQNLDLLPEIVKHLEGGVSLSGEVITATSLDEKEKEKVLTVLDGFFGRNLRVDFLVDEKILGGMIVKIGDRVFDSSLLGKTRKLKESI